MAMMMIMYAKRKKRTTFASKAILALADRFMRTYSIVKSLRYTVLNNRKNGLVIIILMHFSTTLIFAYTTL